MWEGMWNVLLKMWSKELLKFWHQRFHINYFLCVYPPMGQTHRHSLLYIVKDVDEASVELGGVSLVLGWVSPLYNWYVLTVMTPVSGWLACWTLIEISDNYTLRQPQIQLTPASSRPHQPGSFHGFNKIWPTPTHRVHLRLFWWQGIYWKQ